MWTFRKSNRANLGICHRWACRPLGITTQYVGRRSHSQLGLLGGGSFLLSLRPPPMPPSLPKTVLIVEDDDVAREGLTAILEREGFATVSAKNGKEAVQCFQAGLSPSLVLLDMLLPECDGWQFFVRRRKDSLLASSPVVVMT